jgi:serine/threonine-protein kinase SRPK3
MHHIVCTMLNRARRCEYVALQVLKSEQFDETEYRVSKTLKNGDSSHPGYGYVRSVLDKFDISHSGKEHQCLVQKPMWDSFKGLLNHNSSHRFTSELLRADLAQLLLALDYLHSECNMIHTGKQPHMFLILILTGSRHKDRQHHD